jgi:hypothetical protein
VDSLGVGGGESPRHLVGQMTARRVASHYLVIVSLNNLLPTQQ